MFASVRIGCYQELMVAWFIVSIVLLIWNAIYCTRKIVVDFRGPTPASGVWGLFALAGVISILALAVISVFIAGSGI